jgi:hypothetical protein
MRPLAVPPARFAAPALAPAAAPVDGDAVPLVEPVLELPAEPDEFAVPRPFVPGALGVFVELPAPLGSLAELFSPPAFAGPLGTPLTPAVPAPVDPAFGEPTALPVPAVGPLAGDAVPLVEPVLELPAETTATRSPAAASAATLGDGGTDGRQQEGNN